MRIGWNDPAHQRKETTMATYANRNRAQQQAPASSPNPPTHLAKLRKGEGETATFERIGAAWAKDDGSIIVRLYGTQIVSDGFALYPVEERSSQ
jgi:hypothetical protein